jgi:phage I-like protein
VVQFSRRSKTVCALHSVALTNHPALHGIPALAADDTHADDVSFRNKKITKGQKMDEILSLLNLLPLADSSAEEKFREISVAINGLLKIRDSLNDFLERHGTASLEEFTAQVEREKEQLHSEIKRKESGEAVRKAFSDGKITEAQRIWAGKFAQKDIEAFREWSKTAPVIVPDNQGTEQLPEKRSGENNEFQNTIFRNLGLTEKDIKDN